MEFVVLLTVIVIALTQVIARPSDTIEHLSTKDDYNSKEDDVEALKYNLPTILLHEFKITITGSLDLTKENFTVVFPAKEDDESLSCRLNFNYKSNSNIEAISAVRQSEEYSIFYNESSEPEFILELEARKNNGDELEISFNGNESGHSLVICKIQSLENFDHIYFKGVKRINSMLFMF